MAIREKKAQVSLLDVKKALHDPKFRDALPLELREDVAKFIHEPGCACNLPLYRKLIRKFPEHLKAYFPGQEIVEEAEIARELAKNNWRVINCHIGELQNHLKALPPGRKQVAIARYEDQVTVIINELDIIY
ncbi:unnamed protein product [marine sediment metagenome]|uniref:Uncharacterized protein n=1 Tax=marine sediment metagenome TaxID=412755 RepID=X0TCC6_9ZZZZ